jgi:hypothetical protein
LLLLSTNQTMSHWRRSTHQCLAEIAALQHTDEGGRGILKAIRDVFAIAYAPVGDSGGVRRNAG